MVINFVTDSEEHLQILIDVIAEESRKFGPEINKRKTLSMTISKKNASPKCKIKFDGIESKQAEQFEYLRSLITSDAK